jgi:hypothetical protein
MSWKLAISILLLTSMQTYCAFLDYVALSSANHRSNLKRMALQSRSAASSTSNTWSMQQSNCICARRDFLVNAAVLVGSSILPLQASFADQRAPVAIVGASGFTGGDCVRALVGRGLPVRAISRVPIPLNNLPINLVSAIAADVTVPASLPAAVNGAASVIFLASARKNFQPSGTDSSAPQSFEDVDHLGLINVARACIASKVCAHHSFEANSSPSLTGSARESSIVVSSKTDGRRAFHAPHCKRQHGLPGLC